MPTGAVPLVGSGLGLEAPPSPAHLVPSSPLSEVGTERAGCRPRAARGDRAAGRRSQASSPAEPASVATGPLGATPRSLPPAPVACLGRRCTGTRAASVWLRSDQGHSRTGVRSPDRHAGFAPSGSTRRRLGVPHSPARCRPAVRVAWLTRAPARVPLHTRVLVTRTRLPKAGTPGGGVHVSR